MPMPIIRQLLRLFFYAIPSMAFFVLPGKLYAQTQQTQVVPDCVINLGVTLVAQGTVVVPGAGYLDNRTIGCQDYLIQYTFTGSGSLTGVAFQSALTSTGSWVNWPGTVSTGINPNTSSVTATSTFTTGCASSTECNVVNSFVRVLITRGSAVGTLTGTLYGWKQGRATANGGGSGGGTVTACPGATTGQVTVFSGATVVCGIVQSAFDAAVSRALVRLGPAESALPSPIQGYVPTATLLLTNNSPLTVQTGLGIEIHGKNAIYTATYQDTGGQNAFGIEADVLSKSSGSGIYPLTGYAEYVTGGGIGMHGYNVLTETTVDASLTIDNHWAHYGQVTIDPTSTITNYYGLFHEDLSNSYTGGTITNPYYSWFDSRGVGRCKEDSAFDSVGQVICTVYNPQFTKYTPGASNFERIIYGQWSGNVGQIGTEAGGTGTLRDLQMIGNRWLYKTPALGTNTTEVASTAFVQATIAANAPPSTGQSGVNYMFTGPVVPSGAKAAVVQTAQCNGTGTLSCTFTNPVKTGNQIIAVWWDNTNNPTGFTLSTSQSDSCTMNVNDSAYVNWVRAYSCLSAVGGITTVTMTLVGGATDPTQLQIFEATGINAFDSFGAAFNSFGASNENAPVTTTALNDLLFISAYNHAGASITNNQSGWTLEFYTTVSPMSAYAAIKGAPSITTYNTDVSFGNGGNSLGIVQLAFKSGGTLTTGNLVQAPLSIPPVTLPTVANGILIVPIEQAAVNTVNTAADIGATTLYTAPYDLALQVMVSVTCRSSVAGTETASITYTDTSNTVQSAVFSTSAACTTLGASSIGNFTNIFRAKAGTNIQYTTTHSGAQPTYDISAILLQLSTQ